MLSTPLLPVGRRDPLRTTCKAPKGGSEPGGRIVGVGSASKVGSGLASQSQSHTRTQAADQMRCSDPPPRCPLGSVPANPLHPRRGKGGLSVSSTNPLHPIRLAAVAAAPSRVSPDLGMANRNAAPSRVSLDLGMANRTLDEVIVDFTKTITTASGRMEIGDKEIDVLTAGYMMWNRVGRLR